MNTPTNAAGAPALENSDAKPLPINVTPSGLEALKRFEREIATYRRELPRLLAEGGAGRHVLIKGHVLLSVWDTYGDALEAGYEKFGLDEPFFVKAVDPRDPERWASLDAWREARCPS